MATTIDRLCLHEAGHAIVGRHFGYTVTELDRGLTSSRTGRRGFVKWGEPRGRVSRMAHAAVLMAGTLAEGRDFLSWEALAEMRQRLDERAAAAAALGQRCWTDAWDDRHQVWKLLHDVEGLYRPALSPAEAWEEARGLAVAVLDTHPPVRLAERLMTVDHRIDGPQAEDMLDALGVTSIWEARLSTA